MDFLPGLVQQQHHRHRDEEEEYQASDYLGDIQLGVPFEEVDHLDRTKAWWEFPIGIEEEVE